MNTGEPASTDNVAESDKGFMESCLRVGMIVLLGIHCCSIALVDSFCLFHCLG